MKSNSSTIMIILILIWGIIACQKEGGNSNLEELSKVEYRITDGDPDSFPKLYHGINKITTLKSNENKGVHSNSIETTTQHKGTYVGYIKHVLSCYERQVIEMEILENRDPEF